MRTIWWKGTPSLAAKYLHMGADLFVAELRLDEANRIAVFYQQKIHFPFFPVPDVADLEIPEAGFRKPGCHSRQRQGEKVLEPEAGVIQNGPIIKVQLRFLAEGALEIPAPGADREDQVEHLYDCKIVKTIFDTSAILSMHSEYHTPKGR